MSISTGEFDDMLGRWVAVNGTEARVIAWVFTQPLESHATIQYTVEYRSGQTDTVPASKCFRLNPRESRA